MTSRRPVVIAARRTPFGIAGRGLAGVDAAGLLAPVLSALLEDVKAVAAGPGPVVDEVVVGNCRGPGGNVARIATLAAGLGVDVPGVTLDGQCGSGLAAIRTAAALVAAGEAEIVVAGGTESASTAPGGPGRRARFTPAGWPDPDMGAAADETARLRGISRERQDAYAARSHARTRAVQAARGFDAELVPIGGLDHDERPRPGLTVGALARLRPAFSPTGTLTAGNACGVNDGAAAVVVVSERVRAAAGLPGLRVLAAAVTGGDPALPPLAAAPAVRAVLERGGVELPHIARFELTEAFAAQVLACTDELGLDPLGADDHRVCPDGGAIALGHPWSASGAALVVRLFGALVRDPVSGRGVAPDVGPGVGPGTGTARGGLGVAACAVGGGQGVALLVEAVR